MCRPKRAPDCVIMHHSILLETVTDVSTPGKRHICIFELPLHRSFDVSKICKRPARRDQNSIVEHETHPLK
jgi:hypothetical protein